MMSRSLSYILAILVAVVAAAIYLPALNNGFVIWDDDLYILNNQHIRALNVDLFRWAFTDFTVNYWHPLAWISHAVDYAVWGLDPAGHHLTSIALHALTTFLVVLLIIRLAETANSMQARKGLAPSLSGREIAILAGTTGVLFGVHPLHVESVAWVSERKDLLCALFYLSSVGAYIGYAARRVKGIERGAEMVTDGPSGRARSGAGRYALSFMLFAFALASKPMAVTLPFVLLIIDWQPFDRVRSCRNAFLVLGEKAPFFALSLFIALVTLSGQRESGAVISLADVSISARVLMASQTVMAYLGKMLVPHDLLPLYPVPANISARSVGHLAAVAMVCGTTAALFFAAKRVRTPLAAWAWYLVTLLPVLGIVQVGAVSMADRFTYLPGLGPSLLAGLGAALLWRRIGSRREGRTVLKSCIAALAIALLAVMSHLTLKQISLWNNTIGLWTHVIGKEPLRVPTAYFNRGLAFGRMGEIARAVDDFTMAITLSPGYADAYMNRGVAFGMAGQYEEAVSDLEEAVRLMPASIQARMKRALAFESSGMHERAMEDYASVIALDPECIEAYLERGRLSLGTGCAEDAARDFRKACEMGSRDGCISLQSLAAHGGADNCPR